MLTFKTCFKHNNNILPQLFYNTNIGNPGAIIFKILPQQNDRMTNKDPEYQIF